MLASSGSYFVMSELSLLNSTEHFVFVTTPKFWAFITSVYVIGHTDS